MEHLPLFFLFDTPWPSQTSSQSSSRSHPALATLGFHPQYWERATSSVAWGHFLPSFWLHQWFQTFYHSLPFPGCERFSLSQVKVDIIIFSRNFLHFFKIFSFLYGFFFCLNRWNFLCQPSLGNHGHSFSKGLSQLLLTCRVEFLIYYWPYVFHFFFCWFEDFFFLEALWLDFLLLWMPPFCSPHNLCFFWRGYSLLVLLRDNICILLLGAQFFLPWAVFSQLSIEYAFRYCSFFFWRRPLWNLAINGLIFRININIWATAHLPLP